MLGNFFNQRKISQNSQPSQSPATDGSAANLPTAQQPTVQERQMVGSSMQPSMRKDLSVLTHLDARTTGVLQQAEQEAKRIKQETIDVEQLLFGVLCDGDMFQLLNQFGVDAAVISKDLQVLEHIGTFSGQPQLSESTKKVFEEAYAIGRGHGVEFVSPEDILLALFSLPQAAEFLKAHGLKKEKLEEHLAKTPEFAIGQKSVLEKFGIDITAQAKEGKLDPIVGRDREIERTVHILLRRTKNNPILIGDAGVGKTAIVEGLASQIAQGTAPKDLLQKRIIQLDVTSLVAGASHRGEFEERLRTVIKEVQAAQGKIILFIDEIHTLMGAGGSDGPLDASNIIKPFLARGQLQVIGTTTTAEYRKYFEKDKAFERRFQPILIDEPEEEVACQMLTILKPKYEKFHTVVLADEAIKAAVHLSKKYIGERFLPDKAVDLLDEAAAGVRLEISQGKKSDNQVKKEDIEKIVSSWTGIPITKLTEDEGKKLLNLENLIHKRLIDQESAVKAVSEAVRRGRIGLASANRPIASFIFLGPTGTGKTELAKTLAAILFGKEEAMIRLDMSEYMEKHEVAKLIGAPPGYVGYEEGGQLTEAVRLKPYSVVLLDEIEKAHPDVFNILLQLLEDGRLTDNKGNTISFKNTIIIATSNIGSSLIQEHLVQNENKKNTPEDFKTVSSLLIAELRKYFKPELLNRFDDIVVFEPLAEADMLAIATLRIESTKKLLSEQGISLDITPNALNQLAKEGYDPLYGARPLRRLIQTAIENPIALLIIQKTFIVGDRIQVDYNAAKEEFTFAKATQVMQSTETTNQAENKQLLTTQSDSQTTQQAPNGFAGFTSTVSSAAEATGNTSKPQQATA